jgi:hypothetical protein
LTHMVEISIFDKNLDATKPGIVFILLICTWKCRWILDFADIAVQFACCGVIDTYCSVWIALIFFMTLLHVSTCTRWIIVLYLFYNQLI